MPELHPFDDRNAPNFLVERTGPTPPWSPAHRDGPPFTTTLYVMSKRYGTDHPDKVDLITEKDGVCYLYVVESAELDDERTFTLQKKLNNYLSFILDGQLQEQYPMMAAMQKVVRIELQHAPTGIAAEFLARAKALFDAEGVGFEYSVDHTAHDV